MSAYETMWNELKNRVSLNITQSIPIKDMLNLMAAYEEHFKEQLEKELIDEVKQLKEEQKEIKKD